MNFPDNLRNLRIQRKMTQMELAEKLHTSQGSVTGWETGRREPDFKTIKKIAEFFDVPLSALLPSSDDVDDDYVTVVADSLHANPKLKLLFDHTKNFSEQDLDAVLAVVKSISGRRD